MIDDSVRTCGNTTSALLQPIVATNVKEIIINDSRLIHLHLSLNAVSAGSQICSDNSIVLGEDPLHRLKSCHALWLPFA